MRWGVIRDAVPFSLVIHGGLNSEWCCIRNLETAGYQHESLKHCGREDNKWCGRIEFTVGCDVTPEFKRAVSEIGNEDWTALMKRDRSGELRKTRHQWAEVCFVPNAIGHSRNGSRYRCLAIREPMQD